MTGKREAEELLLIEEADAWFEYGEAIRGQTEARYLEIEPWAWARLQQRLARNQGAAALGSAGPPRPKPGIFDSRLGDVPASRERSSARPTSSYESRRLVVLRRSSEQRPKPALYMRSVDRARAV